jgi:acyl carrier protein
MILWSVVSKAQFLDHFSQILDAPSGSVTGDEKLSDLEGWDSVAMFSFITFGDEHFQKTLTPRQFATCETVNDLGKLVGVEG